jgi:uncharacterized protein YndB with AHSA1/START domain
MTPGAEPEVPTDSAAGSPVLEVSRAVPQPPDDVWHVLTTPSGAEALLGKGAELGGKGEPWRSADGSHGVVRSYHPMQQVRISWHADEHAASTLVELHLLPEGEGTRLSLRYQETPDAGVNADLRQRWSDALGRIVTGLTPVSEPSVDATT